MQATHVHGHGGAVAHVPAPDLTHQLVARVHDAGVLQQEDQQVQLAVGQAELDTVLGDPACGQVDG